MLCNICKISSKALLSALELTLAKTHGLLSIETRKLLIEQFPDFTDCINKLTQQDCDIHYNFHQTISRCANAFSIIPKVGANASEEQDETAASITNDIGKDEAETLYELLNTQAATFNVLSNRINSTLSESDSDLTVMLINPGTTNFYKELAESMRSTVKEIRELNASLNGKQDGTLEGLKALAAAFGSAKNGSALNNDLTTNMYDDDVK